MIFICLWKHISIEFKSKIVISSQLIMYHSDYLIVCLNHYFWLLFLNHFSHMMTNANAFPRYTVSNRNITITTFDSCLHVTSGQFPFWCLPCIISHLIKKGEVIFALSEIWHVCNPGQSNFYALQPTEGIFWCLLRLYKDSRVFYTLYKEYSHWQCCSFFPKVFCLQSLRGGQLSVYDQSCWHFHSCLPPVSFELSKGYCDSSLAILLFNLFSVVYMPIKVTHVESSRCSVFITTSN